MTRSQAPLAITGPASQRVSESVGRLPIAGRCSYASEVETAAPYSKYGVLAWDRVPEVEGFMGVSFPLTWERDYEFSVAFDELPVRSCTHPVWRSYK